MTKGVLADSNTAALQVFGMAIAAYFGKSGISFGGGMNEGH